MRADARARRTRILSEARRLFAMGGLHVSLERIAEASGVGIATLYRNFPARKDLVDTVALDLLQEINVIFDIVAEVEDPTLRWRELIMRLQHVQLAAVVESATEYPIHDDFPDQLRSQIKRMQTRFGTLISDLQEEGVVRHDLSANTVLTGLGIATRPQNPAVLECCPGITKTLVEAFYNWTVDTSDSHAGAESASTSKSHISRH